MRHDPSGARVPRRGGFQARSRSCAVRGQICPACGHLQPQRPAGRGGQAPGHGHHARRAPDARHTAAARGPQHGDSMIFRDRQESPTGRRQQAGCRVGGNARRSAGAQDGCASAQLAAEGAGQNGLFHQIDPFPHLFGGLADLPFPFKEAVEQTDDFFLFGKGGDSNVDTR